MNTDDSVTILIGKSSNLSQALLKVNNDFELISSREIVADITILEKYKEKNINLIFNNFQQSIYLGDRKNYKKYIEQAIMSTAMILDYFSETKIKNIIYTSSSSVYGNNSLCNESDSLDPLNFHASLKISNEKMVEGYAKKHQINCTITRIFNMYGGDDDFSVISKIVSAFENTSVLKVVNNGEGVRDFIHIDDVVAGYMRILNTKDLPIINIGTGRGSSVEEILKFLDNHQSKIIPESIVKDEIQVSIADNKLLRNLMNIEVFMEIKTYLKERLKL